MGVIANFFNRIKGKNKDLNVKNTNLMTLFAPYFSGGQSPDLNTTFVSAVNTHAKHISKVRLICQINDEVDEDKAYLNRLLEISPNPIMTSPIFWKTMATSYFMHNVAIAFVEWNYTNIKNPIKAIWPLDFDKNSLECRVNAAGELFVSFSLGGQKKTADYTDLLVLTREVDPSTLPFGRRSPAIDAVLRVLQANYEGIEQSIKTSAFIRFLVSSTTPLTEQAKKEKAKYFAETYLGKDSSGVVYVDQASQVTKVDSQAKYANHEESKDLKNDVLSYQGISEKIIKSEYNEDEWQAYYESNIESFFNEAEAELTSKLLSEADVIRGCRIRTEANRLHSASLKTRKDIAEAYMKLPVYRPNTVCDLLFLPKLENGNKEFGNLNYVGADIQDEYQLDKVNQKPKEKEEKDD